MSENCWTEAALSITCGLQVKADLLMRHTVLDPRIATLIDPWQEYQAVQMRLQVTPAPLAVTIVILEPQRATCMSCRHTWEIMLAPSMPLLAMAQQLPSPLSSSSHSSSLLLRPFFPPPSSLRLKALLQALHVALSHNNVPQFSHPFCYRWRVLAWCPLTSRRRRWC